MATSNERTNNAPLDIILCLATASVIASAWRRRLVRSQQAADPELDVTVPEPLPAGHSLLGREDVIVTPHVASGTGAGRRRLYEHAIDNALAALRGEPATVVPQSI